MHNGITEFMWIKGELKYYVIFLSGIIKTGHWRQMGSKIVLKYNM